MIDKIIGNYKITKFLGEGGMASVYEAEHTLLGTKVAIKVLNPLLSSNAQIKERFKNEAKLMASLDHPNILKVLDFDDQPQQLSIIMEFLEGEDLNKKIKQQGALKESDIIAIFTQTLAAFQYAHDKGIVHRDIKPSNLYILPDGTVKILDFGIAKLFGQSNEMTQTGTQMGTPIYMSPEQVKAEKTIDFRSDIYSLGVTLYYALNGKPPYDSNTSSQFDIFSKIVYEPLTLIGKHGHFDAVISKACAKDREERYQSCMLFLTELNSTESSSKTEEKKAEVEKTIIETKKQTNEAQEKTIIETPIEIDAQPEKTIVENENSDRKENKSEPKIAATTKKRNRLVFLLIFGIILLASLSYLVFFLIDNKDSDGDGMKDKHDHCPYEYGLIGGCPDRDQDAIPDYRDDCPDEAGENERGCPDSDGDGVYDKDDACVDVYGNDPDGCFYHKQVNFTNNSYKKTWLCIGYFHEGNWICEGWYQIEANSNRTIDLPNHFAQSEIYWYAADENDEVEWGSNDHYFTVEYGVSDFKSINGSVIYGQGTSHSKKGFIRISLEGECTNWSYYISN